MLQVLASDGTVVGYVKAAWNDLTAALVRNEARVLADLGAAAADNVHAAGSGRRRAVAGAGADLRLRPAQRRAARHRPDLRPADGRDRRDRRPAGAAAPPAWPTAPTGPAYGNASQPPERQRRPAQRRRLDREALRDRRDGLRRLARRLHALEHGPPDRTATFLWDWERAAPAPAGLDLLHFLFQTQCRFGGGTPERSVEICSERTPGLLPSLEVPLDSERALWLVYRLELLFRYDEAREAGVLARPSKIHAGILEMFARDMEAG